MDNASIAEWILCRLTSKERAASMVGDLVEIGERKGLLWFWLSLAGVVLSSVWRRPLAFVAAFYAGMWAVGGFQMAVVGVHAQHRPPEYPWVPIFLALGMVGSALWAMSFYAAIRYGLQDRTGQMAFAWTGLITTVIYLWWQPVILGVCIAAALFLASVCLLNGKRRKSVLIVAVSVAALLGAEILTAFIGSRYQHFLLSGPWGTREWEEHPSASWAYGCMLVLSFWVATAVWSRMHNWLTRSQRLESEVDG
jgi:hypothetical protein